MIDLCPLYKFSIGQFVETGLVGVISGGEGENLQSAKKRSFLENDKSFW